MTKKTCCFILTICFLLSAESTVRIHENVEENFCEADKDVQGCSANSLPNYDKLIVSDLSPFQHITPKLLDEARSIASHPVTYYLIDGRVYRSPYCLFPARCEGIEHFLVKLAPNLPDVELVINTNDWPFVNKHFHRKDEPIPPLLSFSKTNEYYDIMFPAWTFWAGGPAIGKYPRGIGRWDLLSKSLLDEEKLWPWSKKKNVAFFRGSRTSGERDNLVLLSRAKPHLVDAKYTKNQAWKSPKDTLGAEPADEVSFEGHCKYKYLFNFRGVAASFRFKHLFLCGSVVLHVGSEWLEFFYPSMKPWHHFVPVESNASQNRLEEIIDYLEKNPDEAQKIARNGHEFVKYHLRMKDVEQYWRDLMNAYADRQNFVPVRSHDTVEIYEK